jgi:UDP-2,3-diacylglucosamine pyrophosphatase LpxH
VLRLRESKQDQSLALLTTDSIALTDRNTVGAAALLPTYVETMIVSDVHLGSEVCRARDLLLLLRKYRFKRLILLGDIFADLNFKRLKKEHWELLSYIRKLSNPKRRVETVWVEGNHDKGLTEVMSHLVGVNVYQEYSWTSGKRKYLAVHGHQFDRFIVDAALFSDLASYLFLILQKCDARHQWFSRYVDMLSTRWLRISGKVARGALGLAMARGADVIFCGHTHIAMHKQENGVEYFNTGCWTQSPANYITVDGAEVLLKAYL